MYGYEHRRNWKPQNRPHEAVTVMLRRMLPHRPVVLLCLGCRGAHNVSDPQLVIRCACGTTTVYRHAVLFFLWTALTWHYAGRLYSGQRFESVYDPHIVAMRFYGNAGPVVEHNTRTYVTTQLGSVLLNNLPVVAPTASTRTLAWRRFRAQK